LSRKQKRTSKKGFVKSYAENLDKDIFEVLQKYIQKTLRKKGVYALYDKRDNLLYVGKASKLRSRLRRHKLRQKDWAKFSFYAIKYKSQLDQLESFFLRIQLPPWNKQRGKIGFEKSKNKTKSFKNEAKKEIKRIEDANERDRQKIKAKKIKAKKALKRSERRIKKRIKSRNRKTRILNKITKYRKK